MWENPFEPIAKGKGKVEIIFSFDAQKSRATNLLP